MPSIENGTLALTRRDLSALARGLSAQTGLAHAKALATLATALGYADGNALMGALKTSETPPAPDTAAPSTDLRVTAVPDAESAGYLYTLVFPFITDEDLGMDLDLGDIAHHVTEGAAVGGWGKHYDLRRVPIGADDLGRLATTFGSTPDFFLALAETDTADAGPDTSPAAGALDPDRLPPGLRALRTESDFHDDEVADLLGAAQRLLARLVEDPSIDTDRITAARAHLEAASGWYNDEGQDGPALEELAAMIAVLTT